MSHHALAPLLLPLLSAVVYVAGALFLKRAAELGADMWRTTILCNVTAAVVFAPLLLLGGTVPGLAQFWQPAVLAILALAGQVLTLLALQVGDVSITTPVLGLKIILVALLTTALLHERVGGTLWTAAALSSAAIVLLHVGQAHSHRRVSLTIAIAGLAAVAYACFDVLVQKWAPLWGAGRLLPATLGFVLVSSLLLKIALRRRMRANSATARPWVAAGALCLALQSLMIVGAIAVYRHATVANVLYSSRGLWSVVAVWVVGHWFANREQHYGARVLVWRLSGATLLTAAIITVLLASAGSRSTTAHAPAAAEIPHPR